MDMISNEIIRDLNIKRTFMGVDKVKFYPLDLVKLTLILRRMIKSPASFYKRRRAEVESEGRVSCAEPLH